MKKQSIQSAAVAALVLSVGSAADAQSNVTVYGLIDAAATVSRASAGTTAPGGGATIAGATVKSLDSGIGPGGTRLGFRGQEDLGDGLSANFLLEMGFGVDTGAFQQGGLAFGRQAYVGLSSSSGWSLTAGRQYTPINIAISNSDPGYGFYWGNPTTNSGFAIYESVGAAPGSGFYGATGREDNSLVGRFTAGPVTGRLMLAAGNEDSRGSGRLINPSVAYTSGPISLNASLAVYRQNVESITAAATPEWLRTFAAGGSYDFGAFTLFSGYYGFNGPKNKANNSTVARPGATGSSPFAYGWDRTRSYWVGARIPVGLGTIILDAMNSRYEYSAGQDGKTVALLAAYEYYLSKRTLVYGSFGQVINNDLVRSPLVATVSAVLAKGYGSDVRALSLGIRHTF